MKTLNLYVVFFLTGIAPALYAVDMKAEMPLTLSDGSVKRDIKKGETVSLPATQASLLEAPGHIPMLLVPLAQQVGTVNIKLKPWGQEGSMHPDFVKALDQLIHEIVQVQILLRDKKPREALTVAERLDAKFPGLVQLKLLRATCHRVLGEKTSYEAILKDLPTSPKQEKGL